MPCADGYFILAVGNDGQFARFCRFACCPELAEDERFRTNANRVRNRVALYEILPEITRQRTQKAWVEGLAELAVPAGPVRSEEHTSELQSLMRISYAVFCLKKKK